MRCLPRESGAGEREVIAVLRDISERKSQDRAIETARAELERAMRQRSGSSPP
jgi:cell cycle sensor histidine kinase DivJ